MTDAEREAQIRRDDRNNSEDAKVATSWQFADKTFLLRLLNEVRAEIGLEHLLHGRSEAQLQENLNICVAQKYEALAEVERLRAPPEADVIVMVEALRDCDRPELPLLQQWQVNQVARALTAYGDQCAREARAAAIEAHATIARNVAHRAADNAGCIKEANPGLTLDKLREIDHNLSGQRHAAVEIEQEIRADAPPQSGGGEG